ncbi:unnamed protein product, partial [Polarella glacialis]
MDSPCNASQASHKQRPRFMIQLKDRTDHRQAWVSGQEIKRDIAHKLQHTGSDIIETHSPCHIQTVQMQREFEKFNHGSPGNPSRFGRNLEHWLLIITWRVAHSTPLPVIVA